MKKILAVLLIAVLLTTTLPFAQVQAAAKTAKQYLADGNKLLTQSKYPDALKAFEAAIKLNSKYTEAHVGKGRALAGQEKFAEAVKSYDSAIAINKKHAPAYYYKGIALYELEKYTDAIKAFDTAILYNTKYAEAYNQKGYTLYAIERYEEAIKCFDSAIKLNSKLVDAYINKAVALYLGQEKYAEANAAIDAALKLKAGSAPVFFHKGMILSGLGKYKDAVVYFDQAIKLEPKTSLSYYHKGIALYNLKSYSEAIAAFDKAQQLPPYISKIYYHRGMAYHAAGKYKEAALDLSEAIKSNASLAAIFLGSTNNGIYYNQFLDMSLKIPETWFVQTNDNVSSYLKLAANNQISADFTKALSSLLSLMVTKHPLGYAEGFNPNVTLVLENVSAYNVISKGSDYLLLARESLTRFNPGYVFEDTMETLTIDGIGFHTQKAVLAMGGIEIKQKLYCTIYRGHAVLFTLSYFDDTELQELETMIKALDFK